MVPSRLASKQQARKQLAPQGPRRGPQPKRSRNGNKQCYHAIRGTVFCKFLRNIFFGWTPSGRKRRFRGFLAHFGRLALREIPGLGGKHENTVSRWWGHFWGESAPRGSDRSKVSPRNSSTFLQLTFLPTEPPRAGNREIMVLGHVGLELPLQLPGGQQENAISWC